MTDFTTFKTVNCIQKGLELSVLSQVKFSLITGHWDQGEICFIRRCKTGSYFCVYVMGGLR